MIKNRMVAQIGQGGGNVGKDDSVDYTSVIREGIDAGLTTIDTAEVYTKGESERIIGKAIQDVREKVFLCTKISPEHLSYDEVIDAVHGSLRRLRTDHIDLYQIHWPNNLADMREVFRAFEKVYEEGEVLNFGLSNFLPMNFYGLNLSEYNFGGIVTNQIEYNILTKFAEDGIIPFFRKLRMDIISYCPLNQGDIRSEIIAEVASKYGMTPHQLSLKWLSSKGVISIPSTTNKKHVIQNAESCNYNVSDDDMKTLDTAGSSIRYIKPMNIMVVDGGYGNHKVYYTEREAIENRLEMCPSPSNLAETLLGLGAEELSCIKPVRVMEYGGEYKLHEGRLRYWAWRIAFGSLEPIPCYIIDKD